MTSARGLTSPAPRRRAFSLVEILIAILVLGFGLLGLAAVFPVVVTQQRDAANEMRGPSAAASIKAQVFGRSELVDWQAVADKAKPPTTGAISTTSQDRWNFDRNLQGGPAHMRLMNVSTDGTMFFDTPTPQAVPATARVFPSAYGSVKPQFVWDAAVRRASARSPLEVAVFIRRLDTGIRVPEGRTLSNVLTGEGLEPGGPVEPSAVPVADTPEGENNDNLRRPSGNGTGDYSRLREVYARPSRPGSSTTRPFDRFELPNNASKLTESLVGRTGQLLLDDLGVVRTVLRVDTDDSGDRFIVVDPPFPSDAERQLLYTAQTPVRVEVVRVEVD